eukprot:gene17259-biopygen4920
MNRCFRAYSLSSSFIRFRHKFTLGSTGSNHTRMRPIVFRISMSPENKISSCGSQKQKSVPHLLVPPAPQTCAQCVPGRAHPGTTHSHRPLPVIGHRVAIAPSWAWGVGRGALGVGAGWARRPLAQSNIVAAVSGFSCGTSAFRPSGNGGGYVLTLNQEEINLKCSSHSWSSAGL